MEPMSAEQKQKALFLQLVITFQQAAYQQMGKLPNPVTHKIERDLEQAMMSIDMLDMLKSRTKGNLPEDEARLLDHVLRELKLNFVDEREKDRQSQPPADAPAATASAQEAAADSPASVETPESSAPAESAEP